MNSIYKNGFNTIQSEPHNLVLTKAQRISKRTGIGWALLNQKNEMLCCDATMAGIERNRLRRAICQHRHTADSLIISMEPTSIAFDLQELSSSIEKSSCTKILLCARLENALADRNWRQWEHNWAGELSFFQTSHTACRLSMGVSTLRKYRRPWVTAISAANFTGMSISLDSLNQEFGFNHYLNDLIGQSRAVLFSSFQENIVRTLATENFMHETTELYQINKLNHVESILQSCAQDNRCSVIVLCDMPLLAHLIKHRLVDEIIHHLSNKTNAFHFNTEEYIDMTHALESLQEWPILSTNTLGNCCRMVLSKTLATAASTVTLGGRLN